jgi:2-keto-4-pentenoate hydratase/2-oxohepta-3-ene-1,7-dioic acid hydratase in catechol pathway
MGLFHLVFQRRLYYNQYTFIVEEYFMRFVRFQTATVKPTYGWIMGDKVGPLDGTPFGDYRRLEAEFPFERVTLLAPVQPSKIVCVGLNYANHAVEAGLQLPEIPLIFIKPPTSIIGPNEMIMLPPQSNRVEHEAELAVVIGKGGRWIPAEKANEHILGYTCANDVTARDLQLRESQWTRAKGFDTFCPIGPWIETDLDPSDTLVSCRVNGMMRQMSSTRELVFQVPQLIAFISSVMTLLPGDLILTGTPSGVGILNPGDTVEVEVEGIGSISNTAVTLGST